MTESKVKWLGGFTSADGSIQVTLKKQKDVVIGHHLSLRVEWGQNPEPILAGFFEGDASIICKITQIREGYKLGIRSEIVNKCSLIINEISEILNNLEIKYTKKRSRRDGVIYITVNRHSQVEKLLRLIHPYLLGSKRLQSEIMLKEIIPRMNKNLHLTRDGFLEIMMFVDELNAYKGGHRGKYNREFFIEEWIKE